jgi:hypothetical protein
MDGYPKSVLPTVGDHLMLNAGLQRYRTGTRMGQAARQYLHT